MSQQVFTLKPKKHPSDATRSQRRRSQRRRQQSARQQRWSDANGLIRMLINNILSHDEDAHIKSEFEELCKRNDRRIKAKQTDEQIILKSIRVGCWTVEDIQDETGFTKQFIQERLKELIQDRKVIKQNDLYKPVETV